MREIKHPLEDEEGIPLLVQRVITGRDFEVTLFTGQVVVIASEFIEDAFSAYMFLLRKGVADPIHMMNDVVRHPVIWPTIQKVLQTEFSHDQILF